MDNKREIALMRLSNIEIPSKYSREYIYYKCYLTDMKGVLDKYICKNNFVFDIGCGNKPFEQYIRSLLKNDIPAMYIGSDVVQSSDNKVDIICDATNIPASSSSYDIVICTQVIEHIFDHIKVFKEANRLLKPGGFFIVSSNFVWEMHEVPYDYYRFTRYGFRALLEKSGFDIVEEIANGGKWAVLGQLLLQICWIKHNPTSALFKRKFFTLLRRSMSLLCNNLFLFLDNKHKDSSKYTLNYIFVGKKKE
ncbi:hypothetical protein HMPREF1212_04106 [Parabacteroides sp. HGS0025]|uniref:class I SAM-dependent methyltransferase n=1 Tax=Parabacteroides sp. HGS0025 TaxID=1078087 RepID=UPI000617803A|nr:methyltransferase domain-containing protein [Parabacteroides sp. HGS0025]KKB46610.1 hypothetical protein HMPREF1212_04106 [Parabacteroides sp. HGS0025]